MEEAKRLSGFICWLHFGYAAAGVPGLPRERRYHTDSLQICQAAPTGIACADLDGRDAG